MHTSTRSTSARSGLTGERARDRGAGQALPRRRSVANPDTGNGNYEVSHSSAIYIFDREGTGAPARPRPPTRRTTSSTTCTFCSLPEPPREVDSRAVACCSPACCWRPARACRPGRPGARQHTPGSACCRPACRPAAMSRCTTTATSRPCSQRRSSPRYAQVMLHQSTTAGGMGRMKMVDQIIVPAHGEVAFRAGRLPPHADAGRHTGAGRRIGAGDAGFRRWQSTAGGVPGAARQCGR